MKYWWIIITTASYLLLACPALAQGPNKLQGERVAVYLSKQGLGFSEAYNRELAAWMQVQDSLGLTSENLRVAAAARIGNFVVDALQQHLGVDTAYLANAHPPLGRAAVSAWDGRNMALPELAPHYPTPTTRVLVIAGLKLRTEARQTVLVYSNKLVPQEEQTEVARLHMVLYAPQQGQELGRYQGRWARSQPQASLQYVPWQQMQGPMRPLLGKLLDFALLRLFVGS